MNLFFSFSNYLQTFETLFTSGFIRNLVFLSDSRWNIEVKKPGDGKGKYHACKQEIEEAVPMPKVSWFRLRRSYSIACFTWLLYNLGLSCSDHIACSGATDLTCPSKIKLDHLCMEKGLAKHSNSIITNKRASTKMTMIKDVYWAC